MKNWNRFEARYREMEQQLSDPATLANLDEWRKIAKNHADLTDLVDAFREYKQTGTEIEHTREMLRERLDNDMREMAETELATSRRSSSGWRRT